MEVSQQNCYLLLRDLDNSISAAITFLAARTLFKRALAILQTNGAENSQAAVPFLQGIAKSYLTEGFPPFRYTPSQFDPRMQPGMREQDLFREVGSVNNFPAGERALQQVVKIQQSALDSAKLIPETTSENWQA